MGGGAEIRNLWLAQLLSTEPADRARAEASLRDLYRNCELPVPEHFFWFDSPFRAAYAVAMLCAPHDFIWQKTIDAIARVKREREFMESIRAELRGMAAQEDWETLLSQAGSPMRTVMKLGTSAGGAVKMIQSAVSRERIGIYQQVTDSIPRFDDRDALYRAEHKLRAVVGGQAGWSVINPLLVSSFYRDYSFSMMAMDEIAVSDGEAPPLLSAAWKMARSAGLWWPFSGAVILSDRPAEVHLNDQSLLHRPEAPAALYRDGSRIWAWNGVAMREEWILQPEKISARELKSFDSDFQTYAARARIGRPKTKWKPSPIMRKALPLAGNERVELLRKHNQGRLPFFDRYASGEHEKLWAELIALGASVREDPYAADALAVTYEIMRRVEANVHTTTARLQELGYQSASGQWLWTPGDKTRRQIAELERKAGALPLSLRAFYEIVGAVNWMGSHPTLAPPNDNIAPDPLVVFPINDALAQDDDEDAAGLIMIAPDDLHKSNTSGGDPYAIAVPELGIDGKVLNERHNLYFVDYLRLVFRFGGFPGYEGVDTGVPMEIAALSEGLIAF